MNELEQQMRLEIQLLKKSLIRLQARVKNLEASSTKATLDRYHLLRVKNRDELSDQYITQAMGYLDLSPDKAYQTYNEQDKDFIILDVSAKDYVPYQNIKEAKKIPLEELAENIHHFKNKTQHILVISEKGVRSIHACRLLNEHGFFYLSNISGGYKFWPGFRLSYDHEDFDNFLKEA